MGKIFRIILIIGMAALLSFGLYKIGQTDCAVIPTACADEVSFDSLRGELSAGGVDISTEAETLTYLTVDVSGSYYINSFSVSDPFARMNMFSSLGLQGNNWKRSDHANMSLILSFADVKVPNGPYKELSVLVTAVAEKITIPGMSGTDCRFDIHLTEPLKIHMSDGWYDLLTYGDNDYKNIQLSLWSNGMGVPLYTQGVSTFAPTREVSVKRFEDAELIEKPAPEGWDDPGSPNYIPPTSGGVVSKPFKISDPDNWWMWAIAGVIGIAAIAIGVTATKK